MGRFLTNQLLVHSERGSMGRFFNQSAVGTFGSKVNDICTKGQRAK